VLDSQPLTSGATAVVIVTYNSGDVIADCLDSLPKALCGLETAAVLVVDNASTDDTAAVVAAHGGALRARFVPLEGNLGYASAINHARRLAPPYDLLLVLNPDTVLEPGSVQRLAAALSAPGRGIAVPRLVGLSGDSTMSLRREPTLGTAVGDAVLGGDRAARWGWGERIQRRERYAHAGAIDWATGAVALIRADCDESVGDWNESFFLYSEETDFMLRAQDAGFATWYVPDAVVYHRGGESANAPELWALVMRNKARLYSSRHGRLASALYFSTLLVGELARAGFGKPRSRAAVRGMLADRGAVFSGRGCSRRAAK